MKATIISKGQITIPQKIGQKLNLKPGQVLEFDEEAQFLKSTKSFDPQKMYCFLWYRPERNMKIMNPEERFERIERQLEFMAEIQVQLCASQQRQDAEIA